MCGLGVPVGCRMKHAKGLFKRWHLRAGKRQAWTPIKRFKGFKGLRAGKRQAWDAHKKMCGLGVPVGCRMKHAKGLFKRWRLGAGKRQAWTPIKGWKGLL